MYGGIITHSFITCKLLLKQSGKVPNQCCKLFLKAVRGVDNKIFTIYDLLPITGMTRTVLLHCPRE